MTKISTFIRLEKRECYDRVRTSVIGAIDSIEAMANDPQADPGDKNNAALAIGQLKRILENLV